MNDVSCASCARGSGVESTRGRRKVRIGPAEWNIGQSRQRKRTIRARLGLRRMKRMVEKEEEMGRWRVHIGVVMRFYGSSLRKGRQVGRQATR